jgi:hypothetical protein
MVDKKDSLECKNWLLANHPDLFNEIYPDEEVKEGEALEKKPEDAK